jgi:hypothetical protein
MARLSTEKELAKLIGGLKAERQELVNKLASIDKVFASFGIPVVSKVTATVSVAASPTTITGKRRGRPPGSKNSKRKRGMFSKTGEETVLEYVTSKGPVTAAEVNKHWQGEGRGGKADNTLSKLVKDGKLKRVKNKGERGSSYAGA